MEKMTNSITISGVVVNVNKQFVTISSKMADNHVNIIDIWNLPKTLKKGDAITVLGKLALRRLMGPSDSYALGIKAYNFWFKAEKVNVVAIMGEIVSRKKLVHISQTQESLSFRLKLSDGNIIPVVAYNEIASNIVKYYSPGDIVKIGGVLLSREYEKVVDEKIVTKMTTEVLAEAIAKIPKEVKVIAE